MTTTTLNRNLDRRHFLRMASVAVAAPVALAATGWRPAQAVPVHDSDAPALPATPRASFAAWPRTFCR
jgi:hypothetical protein